MLVVLLREQDATGEGRSITGTSRWFWEPLR